MRLFDIDLRYAAAAILLSPFVAFLIGPTAALALGVAYLALSALVLMSERRSRVDAPGTETGMATLFLWGIAAIIGLIGTVMVTLAWNVPT